jgi:hypothetical protein
MRTYRACWCLTATLLHPTALASQTQIATHAVVARAEMGRRARVVVSSEILHFHVGDEGAPAGFSIAYRAGARTSSTGDVLLSVRPVNLSGVSSAIALTVVSGPDAVPGLLTAGHPTIAARWTGGGVRDGRLSFQLTAAPGTYAIPVEFRITAP